MEVSQKTTFELVSKCKLIRLFNFDLLKRMSSFGNQYKLDFFNEISISIVASLPIPAYIFSAACVDRLILESTKFSLILIVSLHAIPPAVLIKTNSLFSL